MSNGYFSFSASRIPLLASIKAHPLINAARLCAMKDKGKMVEWRPGRISALPWQWKQRRGWEFSLILQEN